MYRLPISFHNPLPSRFRGFRARLALVGAGILIALTIITWRAYHLQVSQHSALSEIAQKQNQRIVRIKGRRGSIVNGRGDVLAISLKTDSFYAHPPRVEEHAIAAMKLSQALDLPRDLLAARLASARPFVWLKRHTTPAEAARVKKLNLKGVGFVSEYNRAYPGLMTAGQVLGFTGIDAQGLEGLEYAYDSYLRGTETLRVVDVDALGRAVLRAPGGAPTGGGKIEVTLHPTLQHIAERNMAWAVTHFEAKLAIALIMRSKTGEILAMAQAPGFNPNDYLAHDKSLFFNRAVTDGYEPGSTFKVITVAAALEAGVVRPTSLFDCEGGTFAHYDSIIHDTRPHGWLTLPRILEVSSNICMAKVGLSMPVGVFHGFMTRFGFGKRVGLFLNKHGKRLAGEAEGYVIPPRKWTPVDHAAISFGHGVLVSPLQLLAAVNVIANGGEMVKPFLVRKVWDASGRVLEHNQTRNLGRVLSLKTADTVKKYMIGVVSPEGTGKQATVKGYLVAGKTGTTEKYDIKARGYSKTKHIASFVGFIPAEDPELTILVLVEEPQKGRYGGRVAAPAFRKIAAESLSVLGIWPNIGIKHISHVPPASH